MSCVSLIINRGDPFREEEIPNKWKWEWTEKMVTVDGHGISVDEYWKRVDKDKYPCLTKALLSSFHGPIVECAFSDMSRIMDDAKGSMIDETYQAVQTVRFHFKAMNKSAVEAFQKEDPLRHPVDKNLCRHMREAYIKRRQEMQKADRATKYKKCE